MSNPQYYGLYIHKSGLPPYRCLSSKCSNVTRDLFSARAVEPLAARVREEGLLVPLQISSVGMFHLILEKTPCINTVIVRPGILLRRLMIG